MRDIFIFVFRFCVSNPGFFIAIFSALPFSQEKDPPDGGQLLNLCKNTPDDGFPGQNLEGLIIERFDQVSHLLRKFGQVAVFQTATWPKLIKLTSHANIRLLFLG